MWIVLVLLFILKVPIHHTCQDPCFFRNKYNGLPELCIAVKKNTDCSESIEYENEYEYEVGDEITLTCIRKEGVVLTDHIATLGWKLTQQRQELLATSRVATNFQKIKNLSYQISIKPDRYDHYLSATCEARSQHRNDYIKVNFALRNSNKNYTDNDLHNIYITEGEPVRNTLKGTVLVYNSTFSEWKQNKIVRRNDTIIYDRLATQDNGTIVLATWSENTRAHCHETKCVSFVKEKSKIFIVPSEKPSLLVNSHDESASASSTFTTIAIAAGVLITLFVILITIICVYCKYFKQRESLENHYEHIIYSEPLPVVYAQVDLKVSYKPAPKLPEEPYAKVIGIFKPKKKPTINTNEQEKEP